jgi:hypothetical protein
MAHHLLERTAPLPCLWLRLPCCLPLLLHCLLLPWPVHCCVLRLLLHRL